MPWHKYAHDLPQHVMPTCRKKISKGTFRFYVLDSWASIRALGFGQNKDGKPFHETNYVSYIYIYTVYTYIYMYICIIYVYTELYVLRLLRHLSCSFDARSIRVWEMSSGSFLNCKMVLNQGWVHMHFACHSSSPVAVFAICELCRNSYLFASLDVMKQLTNINCWFNSGNEILGF